MVIHPSQVEQDYRRACEAAAMFDVSARAKIELSGKDTATFLHNLCTNDIKNLAPGAGCEAFLCTAKARVVAPIRVSQVALAERPFFLVDTEPGLAAQVAAHFDHYLISEQVEIADQTGAWAMLHIAGPQAAAVVEKLIGQALPGLQDEHHFCPNESRLLLIRRRRPLSVPGFDVLCHASDRSAVVDELANHGAAPAGEQAYEILRVEAGTPHFGPDIDADRLVMEVGRTAQAINYSKGCFLGQEPIVMARDRGHVNRALMGVRIVGQEAPSPGSRLFRGAEEVGQITSSVFSPRLGEAIALAYLRRGHQEPGLELIVEPPSDGRRARVSALPFVG